MKKIIAILLIALLFSSCSSSPNKVVKKVESPKHSAYTIKDYFPFNPDVKITYTGNGTEYSEKQLYVDYISQSRIQYREQSGSTSSASVYEISDNELKLITSKGEVYNRQNFISTKNDKPEILLKEPLQLNTTWFSNDGSKRTITDINKDIDTPYGKFKALEVTTEHKDYKQYDYYALNTGLVKTSIVNKNGSTIDFSLKSSTSNASIAQTFVVYYPNTKYSNLFYKKYTINLKTNNDLNSVFDDLFKRSPSKNIAPVLRDKDAVNYISLSENGDTVKIDLKSNFISNMSSGANSENMILNSIVNSLGSYFNLKKVSITLDGAPYNSGHINMSPDKSFTVNFSSCTEIK